MEILTAVVETGVNYLAAEKRRTFILTGVFLVILSAISLGLVQQDRASDAKSVMAKIAVWVIYSYFELKCGIQLNNLLRAAVMLVIISDSLWGIFCRLYITSSVFDKVQHVLGTYAFSLFFYSVICQLSHPRLSRGVTLVFVFSLGLGIGAIYEISEFLGDIIVKPSIPSQTDLLDTELDLIADMFGALAAGMHAIYISKFYGRK